jgi:hypothetical protein
MPATVMRSGGEGREKIIEINIRVNSLGSDEKLKLIFMFIYGGRKEGAARLPMSKYLTEHKSHDFNVLSVSF